MIAIENVVHYSQFLRGGGMSCHNGPHRQASESFMSQRSEEKYGQNPLLWFLQKRIDDIVQAGLRLASFNNSIRLGDV